MGDHLLRAQGAVRNCAQKVAFVGVSNFNGGGGGFGEILVMDIMKQHLNPIFRPWVPKPLFFRLRGPSKQVGDVSKCIRDVFCIELAYGNG